MRWGVAVVMDGRYETAKGCCLLLLVVDEVVLMVATCREEPFVGCSIGDVIASEMFAVVIWERRKAWR